MNRVEEIKDKCKQELTESGITNPYRAEKFIYNWFLDNYNFEIGLVMFFSMILPVLPSEEKKYYESDFGRFENVSKKSKWKQAFAKHLDNQPKKKKKARGSGYFGVFDKVTQKRSIIESPIYNIFLQSRSMSYLESQIGEENMEKYYIRELQPDELWLESRK